MEFRIKNILKELGISANLKGYHYLETAIAKQLNCKVTDMRMMDLYNSIGQVHDTSAYSVERAMRHAIERGADRGSYQLWTQLFGHSISPFRGKPTNKEFMCTVIEYVRTCTKGEECRNGNT